MFEYKADPIQWITEMKAPQYKRACLPGHCGHCGNDAGSLVYQEAFIRLVAGNMMHVNTRSSRLCAKCFPIVVAELRKQYANEQHDLPKATRLYTETIKREGGGNDYREHWQMV